MDNYSDARTFINGFTKHGSPVTDLSRFAGLMNLLGNPQDKLKFIHIAGTNGKGSTVRFCAASLSSAGYKVGEFTSPFIVDYTDRIRINEKNIPHNKIVKYAEIIEAAVGDNKDFSQFEITTAIAFLHFLAEKCEIVCLETGIGGLVDSTNVVKNTLVSVITSISYDHTKILGDTIGEIAAQKAGIIKPDSNVILSVDNPNEVVEIVSKKAAENNCSFIMPDVKALMVKKCDILGSEFTYKGENYTLKMAGRHQINNAISAIEAMAVMNNCSFNIPAAAIVKGLSSAAVCARAEVITEKPLLLIDGAHNPSGAKSLSNLIKDLVRQFPVVMVVGMLAEKNVETSVAEFSSVVDTAICVDAFHPNAMKGSDLAEIFKTNGKIAIFEDNIQHAIEKAKSLAGESGAVIICGSLYLASEARKFVVD